MEAINLFLRYRDPKYIPLEDYDEALRTLRIKYSKGLEDEIALLVESTLKLTPQKKGLLQKNLWHLPEKLFDKLRFTKEYPGRDPEYNL